MVKTGVADSTPTYVRTAMSVIFAMRARSLEQWGWIIVYAAAAAAPGVEMHGSYLRYREVVGEVC